MEHGGVGVLPLGRLLRDIDAPDAACTIDSVKWLKLWSAARRSSAVSQLPHHDATGQGGALCVVRPAGHQGETSRRAPALVGSDGAQKRGDGSCSAGPRSIWRARRSGDGQDAPVAWHAPPRVERQHVPSERKRGQAVEGGRGGGHML